MITNRDSEFEQLRRIDLATGAVEVLTAPHSLGHRHASTRSDDGRYLAWVANVDGISRLTVVNVATRTEILPPLPDGRIGRIAFDRDGKKLALSLESPQSPRDVFVLELDRNAVVRYTKSEAGPVDPLQFAPAELVRFPDVRSRARQDPADPRVRLPARDARPASGAHRHPRRAGSAVRAELLRRSRSSWCARWASS